MTRRVAALDWLIPAASVEIHPADADRLAIADGMAVRLRTRRGAITARARVTDGIAPGSVFMPFHFAEAAANVLTHAALDPVAQDGRPGPRRRGMTRELKPEELRAICDPATLPFDSTTELPPLDGMIGQDRAVSATAFGIGMRRAGYNLFVVGAARTGRTSTMHRVLTRTAREAPTPSDYCYVAPFPRKASTGRWRPCSRPTSTRSSSSGRTEPWRA
jgi:hypothetical protein